MKHLSSLLAFVVLTVPFWFACSGSVDDDSASGDGDGGTPGDGDGDAAGDGDASGDGDAGGGTAGDGDDEASLEATLEGRTFVLESADGYVVVPDTTPTIQFGQGDLGISAGCNQMFSNVDFEEEVLVAEGFGSTTIGCDQALHEQDQWFSEYFSSSPTVSLEGDQVTFTTDEATLIFVDDAVANPGPPLVGTTWEMTAFIDGQVAFGGGFDDPPTVVFLEDGTAQVFTGCNDGELTYEHDDSRINFGTGSGYTERGCPNMGDVEQHVQMVFQPGEVTYSFDGRQLAIDRGDVGVRAVEQQ